MIQKLNLFKIFHNIQKSQYVKSNVSSVIVRYAVTDKSLPNTQQENWSEIYRLPLIRVAAAFNRLKIYQTLITLLGTPAIFALEEAGQLDPSSGVIFASIGITGIMTLTLCSFPIQKLIGFVYMNEKGDKVKIGYTDFWGRRKDQVLLIENILAPWEIPSRRIEVYQQIINREDSSQSFKLLNRYGVIKDPQKYVSVFGDDQN